MHADPSATVAGEVDCDGAVAAFEAVPWKQQLAQALALDAAGQDCLDPDITFTVDKLHLTTSAKSTGQFHVEVCAPRGRKFLRLFGGARIFQFGPVTASEVVRAIQSFVSDSHEAQRALFARLSGTT